jgi:prefoldin alpha subunit
VTASEAELRRGLAVLDQYREQLESLAQQQEIVRVSLEEHMRAKETLQRYQVAGKGAEILVPVGANAFLVAEVRDATKAFVGVGSDVVLFDDIPKQIERLDTRVKSIGEAMTAIGQRLAELQRRAESQSASVQTLYDRLQGAPGPDGRT